LGKNEASSGHRGKQAGTSTRQRIAAGQFGRAENLFGRIAGALVRGFLVALLIATPALMMPGVTVDTSQFTILVALLCAFLTFAEYNASAPSIVEFRDAAPFNRVRFISLAVTIFLLSAIMRGHTDPTPLSDAMTSIGTIIGNTIDFPFSPVRLVVLMLPDDATLQTVNSVRTASGLSYLISLTALAAFIIIVRIFNWPTRNGAFNVWVNMPMFDPSAGGDVIHRLRRDSQINIVLGFLLPFIIPALVKLASDLVDPLTLNNPQTLIWTMTAWAFLPASMIMRGIAVSKVADMIEEKRRRTYADARDEDGLQPA